MARWSPAWTAWVPPLRLRLQSPQRWPATRMPTSLCQAPGCPMKWASSSCWLSPSGISPERISSERLLPGRTWRKPRLGLIPLWRPPWCAGGCRLASTAPGGPGPPACRPAWAWEPKDLWWWTWLPTVPTPWWPVPPDQVKASCCAAGSSPWRWAPRPVTSTSSSSTSRGAAPSMPAPGCPTPWPW